MTPLLVVAISLLSAFATIFSTAPFGLGIAAIIAPACHVYIACNTKSRSTILIVFAIQVPLWLWLEFWVKDVSFVGWIGLALYMSFWAALFVVLLRRVAHAKRLSRLSIVLTAPTLWVGLECMRGIVIFDGYPWYLAGTGLVDWPNAQIADFGGVWLVSFVVIAWAAGVACWRDLKPLTWTLLIMVAITSALYGGWHKKGPIPKRLPMALIQTNVTQSNKTGRTEQQQELDVAEAIQLTVQASQGKTGQGQSPMLIVWPETMLPGAGFELTGIDFAPWTASLRPLWMWSGEIRRLSRELDIPMLVGSHTWTGVTIDDVDGRWLRTMPHKNFNSAVLVRQDGTTSRYDKIFLTPFGERIPYVGLWPAFESWIRESVGAAMLFSLDAGESPNRMVVDGVQDSETATVRIATPICFEDTVPWVVRNLVWENKERQVDVLINLSNDGWFGGSDAGRLQHVREARMRCIENRTPMVRAANTGQSCLINARGTVQEVATVDGQLALRTSSILYVSPVSGWERPWSIFVCDSVAWACLIGSILLVVFSFKTRSASSHEYST